MVLMDEVTQRKFPAPSRKLRLLFRRERKLGTWEVETTDTLEEWVGGLGGAGGGQDWYFTTRVGRFWTRRKGLGIWAWLTEVVVQQRLWCWRQRWQRRLSDSGRIDVCQVPGTPLWVTRYSCYTCGTPWCDTQGRPGRSTKVCDRVGEVVEGIRSSAPQAVIRHRFRDPSYGERTAGTAGAGVGAFDPRDQISQDKAVEEAQEGGTVDGEEERPPQPVGLVRSDREKALEALQLLKGLLIQGQPLTWRIWFRATFLQGKAQAPTFSNKM